jgi:flagellar basal-body rod protein FlgG
VNRALYAAATGMAAQQQTLDVVTDNLANADVPGFKRAAATFAAIGGDLGTASTGVRRLFEQGKLERSGGPFDVAIDGEGFFALEKDGRRAYTRAGSFSRAADGTLRTSEGWKLTRLRIPADATKVDVAADGRVTVDRADGSRREIGRVMLASFAAPERLRPIGSALFAATPQSGPPAMLAPGREHGPKLAFGMLERANVSIIEAMMAILAAQRAYEANAKGVQAADEMQRIANPLQSIANDLQEHPLSSTAELVHGFSPTRGHYGR